MPLDDIHHLAIRLGVIDGREISVDERVMGDGQGEAHQCRPTHVMLRHLQDFRYWRTISLEVLDVEILVVRQKEMRTSVRN